MNPHWEGRLPLQPEIYDQGQPAAKEVESQLSPQEAEANLRGLQGTRGCPGLTGPANGGRRCGLATRSVTWPSEAFFMQQNALQEINDMPDLALESRSVFTIYWHINSLT